MKLGFDIDGVISDFVGSFVKVVKKHHGLTLTEADIYCHDLNLVLGISKQEMNELIRETLLSDIELMPKARRTLMRLESEGHQILILTARFKDLIDVTKTWLKKKKIPYSQLIQLNEGEKYLAEVELDLIVEDNLEDALEWSQKIDNILVYDHPWNQTLNVKGLIKRVHGWNEVFKEIQLLETKLSQKVHP
jgi:uncharacterized HAD superfamily protein